MVSCHNPVYSDESSSMKRLSTKLSISVAITTWQKVMSEMPKKENCTIERDNLWVLPLDDPVHFHNSWP